MVIQVLEVVVTDQGGQGQTLWCCTITWMRKVRGRSCSGVSEERPERAWYPAKRGNGAFGGGGSRPE